MPKVQGINKVLVIGSGPIVIGQAAEFDYAGTQACLSLKEEGVEVILVNNNPATIMTDETVADKLYMEPLTAGSVEAVIQKEKPDGLIGTLGGQTGLNLTVELYEKGILAKYGVTLLGTSVEAIQKGEDREKFRQLMMDIGEPIPESSIVASLEEGRQFVKESGYPVIIRPAYTLGGAGGGFASSDEEYEKVLKRGLTLSPINQVLVEKSIKGWKEVEYEVMRDTNDTCTIVCNMENMDPVGVHTGDSIVVAPSQTLSDVQYQLLRDASLKVIRALDVVGGCNIQFALHPETNEYCIIEVNPRVSRSSALASKATGYPIARIAAKVALGYDLDEIKNPITATTFASFEPALDYIVVKLPRFPFDKFPEADRTLGTQMKATGEVMAIDRSFEGALNKAIRSLEMNIYSLDHPLVKQMTDEEVTHTLEVPTDLRLFAIGEAFKRGLTVEDIHRHTQIHPWFLKKIANILDMEKTLTVSSWETVLDEHIHRAKNMNIGDEWIASLFDVTERDVRQKQKKQGLTRGYKLVDTCAAEFDAVTPYYYATYQGEDEVPVTPAEKILVIGSGPIRIGQGVEFDYCSVHAAKAVQKLGFEAVVMNNNPETVSTDYAVADRLYFEPLAAEDILAVAKKEQVKGVLVQFGGQTAINVAEALAEEGVTVFGTPLEAIDRVEDREKFYGLLNKHGIPHIPGKTVSGFDELDAAVRELGFPVMIRPSYVIGGQSMFVCENRTELVKNVKLFMGSGNQRGWPLLVDRFMPGMECEMDVISDGESVMIPGIFEHVEKAGVHSGDSTALFPPVTISEQAKETMLEYAETLAVNLPVSGMMNIQFVLHDNQVYVLEVNPRASRTVPIMSKVTGVPMVEWATRIQLGEKVPEEMKGLLAEPDYFTVKAPVFSASKLPGVDHVLGPEMKSTGETLGFGFTLEEAYKKVIAAPPVKNHPLLFCSIAEGAKQEALFFIQACSDLGYEIAATKGTGDYLNESGIVSTCVEGEELSDWWKSAQPDLVFNIPTMGRTKDRTGFLIRELAVTFDVPCFTAAESLKAWLDVNSAPYTNGQPVSLLELTGKKKFMNEVKRCNW
ncbi:carbamoyl-phosphate synthase (glutamine-hydrolyzing) large subunit [Alteribacter keqinensis]|uniref:Carbamoyl phosphate synthase large chain n=1 Tax=Alteribacter keqinensis TaxID=2483800 RepID=A0A3M7TW55_9BACI|nr:carbamoyl-phosphate synthase (glutamine-hydrolyzing) large subunit [Alteribacter keqinensis]RNA69900.1 carbamoyl-phosphate synthase (glutamine-hydrolyzing) large subunit [Alteribacter keqinensis]